MPKKKNTRSLRRTVRAAQRPTSPQRPRPPATRSQSLRTQVRGGRPPRIPGRTGGR